MKLWGRIDSQLLLTLVNQNNALLWYAGGCNGPAPKPYTIPDIDPEEQPGAIKPRTESEEKIIGWITELDPKWAAFIAEQEAAKKQN